MKTIKFEYKNHGEELIIREVFPSKVEFGMTSNFAEPEWLLRALDVQQNKNYCFVLKNIHRMININTQRFFCVTVFVKNYWDKFLMLHSNKTDRWLPPSGKVEPHETPDETAKRICIQKTGIRIQLIGEKAPVEGGLIRPHGNQLIKINSASEEINLVYLASPLQDKKSEKIDTRLYNIQWYNINEIAEINTCPSVLAWSQHFTML